VEPTTQTLQIKIPSAQQKIVNRSMKWAQLPVTGAYAFTDYRSQGQTILYTIIDLASPPTSKLSLFNLYVTLSRSKGHSNIRILRDFDDNIFKQSHDSALTMEDEHLKNMNKTTLAWWTKIKNTTINSSNVCLLLTIYYPILPILKNGWNFIKLKENMWTTKNATFHQLFMS
jgi:hypothetical protein